MIPRGTVPRTRQEQICTLRNSSVPQVVLIGLGGLIVPFLPKEVNRALISTESAGVWEGEMFVGIHENTWLRCSPVRGVRLVNLRLH